MSQFNIKNAIDDRTGFTFGGRGSEALEYSQLVLASNPNEAILVLGPGEIGGHRREPRLLMDNIFSQYKLCGLFTIPSVYMETNIKLMIVMLSKKSVKSIKMGEFIGKTIKPNIENELEENKVKGVLQTFDWMYTEQFNEFLNSVSRWMELNEKPNSTENSDFYTVRTKEFNFDRFTPHYYNPKFKVNFKGRELALLQDYADIIQPHLQKEKEGKVVTSRDFAYPFNYDKLENKKASDLIVQKNDIIFFIHGGDNIKVHLFHEVPPFEVCVSMASRIIRIREDMNPKYAQYLFLYLTSDTAKKYIQQHTVGGAFLRISMRDLHNTPIIAPTDIMLDKAVVIFNEMYAQKENQKIDVLQELLHAELSLEVDEQKELMTELLKSVEKSKNDLVKNIIEDDLFEIEQCMNVGAYKACLTLIGSVLEAFLLDWLSDIDHKFNYLHGANRDLYNVIRDLERLNKLVNPEFRDADEIRYNRNYVHPKKLLNSSTIIDAELCAQMIEKLNNVLKARDY